MEKLIKSIKGLLVSKNYARSFFSPLLIFAIYRFIAHIPAPGIDLVPPCARSSIAASS